MVPKVSDSENFTSTLSGSNSTENIRESMGHKKPAN